MDVRNAESVEPEVEHNGTVAVWWLIDLRVIKEVTDGGHLELANEFEVAVGRSSRTRTRRTSSTS